MPTLMVPTIHINGSGKEALLAAYRDAYTALRKAVVATQETFPNGRDYYPQGAGAIDRATKEHRSRIQRLEEVQGELAEIFARLEG